MGNEVPNIGNSFAKYLDEDMLLCKLCGGNNLHQKKIEVIFRHCEDGDGQQTICDGIVTEVKKIDADKIAYRRDELIIYFDCESCENGQIGPALRIYQHKGSTYLSWN